MLRNHDFCLGSAGNAQRSVTWSESARKFARTGPNSLAKLVYHLESAHYSTAFLANHDVCLAEWLRVEGKEVGNRGFAAKRATVEFPK